MLPVRLLITGRLWFDSTACPLASCASTTGPKPTSPTPLGSWTKLRSTMSIARVLYVVIDAFNLISGWRRKFNIQGVNVLQATGRHVHCYGRRSTVTDWFICEVGP